MFLLTCFGQLPSSKGDLYVPASGRKAFVHNIVIHNTNTTAEDVVLNYHDGSTEKQWLSQTIAAGDTLTLDFPGEGDVVGVGGKYTGNTDTASKVTFKFSGTEEVPDTIQDNVLWEWNGMDITQFGDGAGTPDYTYGTPDGTLSVSTPTLPDVPSGNVLRYTTGTATSALALFAINDLPTLPERFIYRIRLGDYDTGCAPSALFAAQDGTHHFHFGWYTTQTTWAIGNNNSGIYEAGIYLRAGGPGAIDSGIVFEFDVMLRDPDTGVDPQMNAIVSDYGIVNQGYVKGGAVWTTWGGSSAAYHSSWQSGGSVKNPGVMFTCNGTAQTSWIGELQILRHPWAKVA
jgi:hypothetical protein